MDEGGSTPAKFMFPGDTDPYGWGTDGAITQTIGTIQMDGPRITQVIHLMTVDFFNRQGHLLWSRVQSTELLQV